MRERPRLAFEAKLKGELLLAFDFAGSSGGVKLLSSATKIGWSREFCVKAKKRGCISIYLGTNRK
jgi:hypothetical protein